MDRKWMSASHLTVEYQDGVKEFIRLAVENAKNPDMLPCPCTKCFNCRRSDARSLKDHLIIHGIDQLYTCWIWHGEKEQPYDSTDAPLQEENYGTDHFEEMAQAAEENFNDHPNIFNNFLCDAREPLYPSCTKFTKLSGVLRLYNLKAQGKSDSVVTRCLSMINSVDDVDVVVNMPTSIFHQEYLLHFGKREMKIWLDERELETRHIEIYIKCLFENYNPRKFAFLSPTNLAWPVGTERRVDERVEYMVNSLRNSDMTRRLWFAPYFGGSMEQFNETRMPPTNPKIRKRVLRWKIIKAPKLPTDDKSGYYICRYMRKIIENDVHDIPQMYFKGSPKTYDKDHLHELHKEWLEFVEPLIQECIDID